MPTNYPSALDDATTLGPTFINDVAVTDQARQIDATLRTNVKDAVLALEARIGITNSTVTSSLAWATMSIGGTDNQGLRVAGGGSATWPGSVGEDGIFLDSVTGFPAWHRSGEAVGTFYQLASAASAMTMQNSYNGGGSVTTAAADDIAFTFTATEDFTLTHAANSRTIITGDAHTATNGLLDINYTNVGVTAAAAINVLTSSVANNQEVGCSLATLDQDGDLADTEIHYGYAAALDMSGDGPGAGLALGAGFYAISSAFTGANNYESAGLLVDSTYDWGVYSNAPVRINGPATSRALELDSDPVLGAGSVTVANAASAASHLLQMYSGTLAGIGTTATERFRVAVTGATNIYANLILGSSALYVDQAGAGDLLTLYDSTNTTDRLLVTQLGETVVTADTPVISLYGAALTVTQVSSSAPLVAFDGTYNAVKGSGNITDTTGVGAVVGPQAATWSFRGMAKVRLAAGGGGIGPGTYWIALYS